MCYHPSDLLTLIDKDYQGSNVHFYDVQLVLGQTVYIYNIV